jgi:hypothetical protein
MKKFLLSLALATVLLVSSAAAPAGYPWKDHAAPYSFRFGNEFDTHQQSLAASGNRLKGFLYIVYTGEIINGIPVAEHRDCTMSGAGCQVGWQFAANEADGQYTGQDMTSGLPQFCLASDDVPAGRGYSHFHWLGDPMMDMGLVVGQKYPGYLIRLTAVSTFYFRHHNALTLVRPGVDTVSHFNISTCQ